MLLIRSLAFNFLFYLNLIILLVVSLPALLMPRRVIFGLARIWARSSLWLLRTVCGTKVEFRGIQNIPPAPFIVAAKHQSMWETFALTLLFDDFCYILKRELTFIPIFGWYLWKAEQIAIDRTRGSSALSQAAEKAKKIFSEKRVLFIFPEGTRRPAGAPPKYKFGVAHLYDLCNVPCLPVSLNSGLFWARRSWLRRPGTIVIDVLEPIAPGMEKQQFFELVQKKIEASSERLLLEATKHDPSLQRIIERNRQVA